MTDFGAIHGKLENARRELLDLSTRNRLLHTPRSNKRSSRLEIVDELSDEIYRILVQHEKPMSFLEEGGENACDHDPSGLFTQPAEDADTADDASTDGVAERHLDCHLQTALDSENLQKRLLKTYYDARTFEEEQGVNILYLAMGFLRWYEDSKSDRERQAPLLLIPVRLDRRSANSRFQLRFATEDITTNLSLQAKLQLEFGIQLPEVPDAEELVPTAYFAQVREAIKEQDRWQVLPNDMVMWFFSFSKFLMYRDLQPDVWPQDRDLPGRTLVRSLLNEGFRNESPICDEQTNIDEILQPLDMVHVMDADSSQTLAIEEVKRGRNLIIQGPPGTGKSQTITNLIATAVKEGKRVLFVAEKMAALEVVKRRLDSIGVGDMCLELHSHRANKRAVLSELERTQSLGRPQTGDSENHAVNLQSHRDRLNRHAKVLHSYLTPAHVTPFQALGELVRLRAANIEFAEFSLQSPLSWSPNDVRQKRSLLRDLTVHMQEVGNPSEHRWRGVQLDAVLPTDIDRLTRALPDIHARIERLTAAANELATLLDKTTPATLIEVSAMAMLGQRIANAPPMDRRAIADEVWERRRTEIGQLITHGRKLSKCRQMLSATVAEAGWTTDVTATRRDLAAHGRSLFRIFNGDYRRAQATLRGILADTPPRDLTARIQIVDTLITGQKSQAALDRDEAQDKTARAAFGDLWKQVHSDWDHLDRIAQWESECAQKGDSAEIRRLVSMVADPGQADALVKRIARDLKPLAVDVQELFKSLRLDTGLAFGAANAGSVPLADLQHRVQLWQDSPRSITNWIAYHQRWKRLEAEGLGELADQLDQGRVVADEAISRFEVAYYEALMREAFRLYPELAAFNGVSHENVLASFKALDAERLTLARLEVAAAHYKSLPLGLGEAGELGVLRREMKKKRGHLPLRKLLQQAGHAIQAIKPVMMMSPISVAQFLKPGVLDFDLLLIDEASQVRPVEALGAIARANQLVVVGDDRQLPPSHFFSKVASDSDDETDDETAIATNIESILGLCEAQCMPQRMLQWHYRSRHHSLIAVSNREFYDDRLYVVPSPFSDSEDLGLKFRLVEDGCFDRGGSSNNPNEAKAVAAAVMEHARRCPDKTLGVGAFSVAQRDAILNELELLRREHPELEAFFMQHEAEPFFVKNLENIQGDERDVIFISIGYGRDSSGYMAMSFGPLNNDGGERRLNVLISRSKERCEVFSSITADDIDLNRTNARGCQALKSFLTYAQKGLLCTAMTTDRECDSEFEREVARAITQRGFQVECQVGVAGFFIDLAIVDSDCPGRYLLGIECDGASYHSSRSARDRDRLRQQVLEDRGWIIHRIWSTDWFHRPEEQLQKVLGSIEAAKIEWAARAESFRHQSVWSQPPECAAIEREDTEANPPTAPGATESVPYVEADFKINTASAIHTLSPGDLVPVVTKVVQIEGPIHLDEIARRIATLWGLSRTGRRIAEAVEAGLSEAVYRGKLEQFGLYYQFPNAELPIRNRDGVQSSGLRKPEYLPPQEIQQAIRRVVSSHLGITAGNVAPEVARLFGFRMTSAPLRQVIEDELQHLVEQSVIEQRSGRLYTARDAQAVEV